MNLERELEKTPNHAAIAVAVTLCFMLGGCGSRAEPAPQIETPPDATGSLIVRGAGEGHFEVFDASGSPAGKWWTGTSVELPVGDYEVAVYGIRVEAHVEAGRETVAADAGTLIVRGKGETQYAVLDDAGRQLDKKWTNTPVELLPGDYVVEFRGTRLNARVEAAGETVAGETGGLIVRGGGQTQYAVLDRAHRQLDKKWTNTPIELLPGNYVVEFRGTRLETHVESGRETVAAETGSLIVRGGGQIQYNVLDEEHRKLAQKWTNTSVELLPGDYVVEVRGTRLHARVEPGRETLAAETGDLIVSGDGQAQYTVYDDARHKLDQKWTNAEAELLPGSYIVRLGEQDLPAVIEAGRQTRIGL